MNRTGRIIEQTMLPRQNKKKKSTILKTVVCKRFS
jgi:hypothetical protein